jgi:hypothetical protein
VSEPIGVGGRISKIAVISLVARCSLQLFQYGLPGPAKKYWNNCELQLATNDITQTFELRPPTSIGSFSSLETDSFSETSNYINLLTRLSARERLIED